MKTASAISPAVLLSVIAFGCSEPLVNKEAATRFQQSLGSTTITVFPTFVRAADGISYDDASAARIAEFFARNSLAKTVLVSEKISLAGTKQPYQQDRFRESLHLFANSVQLSTVDTDYAMVAEYLVAPAKNGGEAVGGIHCYLVNRRGEPVFLVMLNSHDEIFAKAAPKTVTEATAVLLDVLENRLKERHGD